MFPSCLPATTLLLLCKQNLWSIVGWPAIPLISPTGTRRSDLLYTRGLFIWFTVSWWDDTDRMRNLPILLSSSARTKFGFRLIQSWDSVLYFEGVELTLNVSVLSLKPSRIIGNFAVSLREAHYQSHIRNQFSWSTVNVAIPSWT